MQIEGVVIVNKIVTEMVVTVPAVMTVGLTVVVAILPMGWVLGPILVGHKGGCISRMMHLAM